MGIPAYLQTSEFETVWNLAHNMAGIDPESTKDHLSEELKLHLFNIAITWRKISVRTTGRLILDDDSLFTYMLDWRHFLRITKVLRQGEFDKEYLGGLFVRRSEVIAWCEKDYLAVPPKWAQTIPGVSISKVQEVEDDSDTTWYGQLTASRKKRVTCLEIAKKLWEENPNQTYEEIYKNPGMIRFGGIPRTFTFEQFKKWARPFAPDFATSGGRRSKTKQL